MMNTWRDTIESDPYLGLYTAVVEQALKDIKAICKLERLSVTDKRRRIKPIVLWLLGVDWDTIGVNGVYILRRLAEELKMYGI